MSFQPNRAQGKRTVPRGRPRGNSTPTVGQRSRRGEITRARLVKAAKEVFDATAFSTPASRTSQKGQGVLRGLLPLFRFQGRDLPGNRPGPGGPPHRTRRRAGGRGGAAELSPRDRIGRANRLYLQRYRDEAPLMGVIEEVSRYDPYVNDARMASMKHFVERSERSIRRLQQQGQADRRSPSRPGLRRTGSHGRPVRRALAHPGLPSLRIRRSSRTADIALGQRHRARHPTPRQANPKAEDLT